ncbi:uncharacterized protein J4E92_003121 [Alternaria infectoria]|uniref:uncharacterized protein n=1 Tax=Alternaria infectoria TaxID=45303 RepID=UPI002220D9B5|nr:uncharacterized protein J4E92_003121 [Alternaria infectoria]KAI4933454.1 hypothetical protein J4E92_003121 [Alternaria infectoria]
MDPHQQHGVRIKEEHDELGIWVPVKQECFSEERLPAVVPKVEPIDDDDMISTQRKNNRKANRVRQTTKDKNRIKRLETELRQAHDDFSAQRMKDIERNLIFTQAAITTPKKPGTIKHLLLENLQLQKRLEETQQEVETTKRNAEAYNNSVEHKKDVEDQEVIRQLWDNVAAEQARNRELKLNLEHQGKKLKAEGRKRRKAEERLREVADRLYRFTGFEEYPSEESEEELEEGEILEDEEIMEQVFIKDEELMEDD